MGVKTGVKLAYKQSAPCGYAFVPVFTSDSVPPWVWTSDASCPALAGQEDARRSKSLQ